MFKKMSPILPVAHIEQSIEFYTTKLGFSLDFRYEDFYAGILKDGHSIHLKADDSNKNNVKNKDELNIIFAVEAIELLYEDLRRKSIEIVQPLREMPYGREFYIADPDGNHLGFVE
jgi:predicted enzyme related to lactoylglutathione lyase